MNKAEEGKNRTGNCEIRRLHKFPLDDEHPDCAKNQPGQNGTATQHFQPMIENAGLPQLIQPDGRDVGSSGGQGIVDLQACPKQRYAASVRE